MTTNCSIVKRWPVLWPSPLRPLGAQVVQLSAESATGVPEVATKARSQLVAPTGAVRWLSPLSTLNHALEASLRPGTSRSLVAWTRLLNTLPLSISHPNASLNIIDTTNSLRRSFNFFSYVQFSPSCTYNDISDKEALSGLYNGIYIGFNLYSSLKSIWHIILHIFWSFLSFVFFLT